MVCAAVVGGRRGPSCRVAVGGARRRRRRLAHQRRHHDDALAGRVLGVAGGEREAVVAEVVEHLDLVGADDELALHLVAERPLGGGHQDLVALLAARRGG